VATREFPFAAVILAAGAIDADSARLAEMVRAARTVGAEPVVVVAPRGWAAVPNARMVHVAADASSISALRAGMAQLSNTTSRFALLWPFEERTTDVVSLLALVDDVKRERATMTVLGGDTTGAGPLMIARDAWLDLMTGGVDGLSATLAARQRRTVKP
jgi:hypothetical protein